MRGGATSDMSSTCVPGGIRSISGYQANMHQEPSSPQSAWQYHNVIPKTEPVDPDVRNDSGLVSGSDCVSSSPGSDQSEHFNTSYSPSVALATSTAYGYYPQNFRASYTQQNVPSHMYPTDRLTPPDSDLMVSPKSNLSRSPKNEIQTVLPPCTSLEENSQGGGENSNGENALKKLQASFEKKALSESGEDSKSNADVDELDNQGIRVPKVNSHGKLKTFKCKQCDFVTVTKLQFWKHNSQHIKADKILSCPKCPFITEYKHHLEYHVLNHSGAKPYKCDQCQYSCVNKSMLNSHLKSHSNIYQYRCADCSYVTKYCHSLKLHLRKYRHKPAMVLNPDGTPNPLPIIDVYGTRRGPKLKSETKKSEKDSPKPDQMLQFPMNQFLQPMQFPYSALGLLPALSGALPNPLLLQNLEKWFRERQDSLCPSGQYSPNQTEQTETVSGVLDLSKPEESSPKRRKVSTSSNGDHSSEDEDDETTTTMFGNVEVIENKNQEENIAEKTETASSTNQNTEYCCHYCDIKFGEPVMYTLHMGYHGYRDPFTCNMCGEECKDKTSLFLHIARNPHY